jgi:glucokinase
MADRTALLADIGATHARFALSNGREITGERVLQCANFDDIDAAIKSYLSEQAPGRMPPEGAFAVACPVLSDHVTMTNHPWNFSITGLRDRLGFEALQVVNDFAATALAVPAIDRDYIRSLTPDRAPRDNAPIGILGPGTGLGVASLIPAGNGYIPVPGEGGHVSAPAHTEREFAIIRAMHAAGHEHVSAERVCSGQGLANIYSALCALEERDDLPGRSPEDISAAAFSGDCEICEQALEQMFVWLGRVAGDLALTIGAHGGIYIAGGIAVKLDDAMIQSGFQQAFEDKGRFTRYLQDIPCYLIDHPYSAFIGLNRLLDKKPYSKG